MEINFIQMVLIIIFSIWCIYDYLNTKLFYHCGQCVVMGWVTGLILGNGTVGLKVGATLQLMTLGVAAWGGSAVRGCPVPRFSASPLQPRPPVACASPPSLS